MARRSRNSGATAGPLDESPSSSIDDDEAVGMEGTDSGSENEAENDESEPGAPPFSEPSREEVNGGGAATGDDAGVDPLDARGLEAELNGLMSRLTGDLSELAMIKLLPRAKEVYERLHPETRHGGDRSGQVAESATCPSFATYAAKTAGFSKRSIYTRLERAEELKQLDQEAEAAVYGTSLANRVGMLIRVVRLPKPEIHRDIVTIYKNAGPKRAKDELCRWEDEFGIERKSKSKPDPEPDPTPEPEATPPDSKEEETSTGESPAPEDASEVAAIIAALGVSVIGECVPAIEKLKELAAQAGAAPTEDVVTLNATITELRLAVGQAAERVKVLEQELSVMRKTPLSELFHILKAKTAKQALQKARTLMENDDAAE